MILDIAAWWLFSLLIAMAGYPLLSLFSERDVYGLSRGVSIVLLTYGVWVVGHVVPVSPALVYGVLLVLVAAAALIVLRSGVLPPTREVVVTEAVFAGFFLFFLVTRLYSPDIAYIGGEKFMDSAFMRAMSHASFPATDPWMAGADIFYYYAGYLAAAIPQVATGVPWDRSFNLVVPFFAGAAGTAAYSVGRLLRARPLPLVALFSGNLASFGLVVATGLPSETVARAASLLGVDETFRFSYFTASRVIPGTINEFPFFTLLHADPHPHLFSLPLQLTLIGLLALYLRGTRVRREYMLPLIAVTLGLFYPLNTWEFPTYAFLSVAVIVLASGLVRGAAYSAGTVAASVLLFLPYHIAIDSSRGIDTVTNRSELTGFLGVNGILFILILAYLYRKLERREFLATLGGVVVFGTVGSAVDFGVLVVLPLIPAGALILYRDRGITPLLLLTGTFIALGVEVLRVEGVYTGQLARMNTVFKLYLQLWIMWSVPAAAGLAPLFRRRTFSPPDPARLAALGLVLVVMLSYPALGTYDRAGEFNGEPTLSGTAYVQDWRPGEYEALEYLDSLERGVVMEAWGNAYKWNTVAGCLTRHDTVMGWVNHEVGWREDDDPVHRRMSDVDRFYERGELTVLRAYDVDYVYLGPVERQRYPGAWNEFDGRLEKLFDNGDVKIYRAPDFEGEQGAAP